MKTIFLYPFIVAFSYFNALSQQVPVVLTDDGAWCWFSDPRAVCVPGKGGRLVTGFVTENGSVTALQYNLRTGAKQLSILYDRLEVDDHNNPAFLQRSDGTLLAFYTMHHNADLYMNRTTLSGDASGWEPARVLHPNGKAELERFGDNRYTYANPFMLSGENNRIYLFGRWTGFKPNFTWSDDGGTNWAGGRVVVSPKPFTREQRPYVVKNSPAKAGSLLLWLSVDRYIHYTDYRTSVKLLVDK